MSRYGQVAARITVLLLLSTIGTEAQTLEAGNQRTAPEVSKRSFALVLGPSVETVRMAWNEGDGLEAYVHGHPGRYIVFAQNGVSHRLDDEAALHAAEALYAPMVALAARQKALAAEQRPLAEQQRALSAEMRAASTPLEMQRIGAAQGSLGRQQGEIGGRQGEIGRRQREIGRALNASVQRMIDACLGNGSCPKVGG